MKKTTQIGYKEMVRESRKDSYTIGIQDGYNEYRCKTYTRAWINRRYKGTEAGRTEGIRFINKLNEILLENDICFNSFTDIKHNNLHYIRTAKLDTIKKFFDFIYEDSVEENRLKRKYDKFISLLEGRCA